MKPLAQKSLRVALALSLAMASGAAAALGLGQIELKSKLGQPLVAEIPVISSDPAELEQLQAGLPSPDTFARIGLQLPDEFVSSLQFTPGVDAAGRPVIRVTSEAPVTDPLLTFLVEVDWGQGRLVREYSALVDAPRTVSAPVQPVIEEATVGPANTIEREPAVAATDAATDVPAEGDGTPTDAQPPADANATAATPAPTPSEAIPSAPAAPAAAVARMGAEYGPVKSGDTLSRIAAQVADGAGQSLDQTMIALLRANPEAFIRGNVNLLKRGAVLQLPEGQAAGIDPAEATALVQAQTQAWRAETRRPVQQPSAAEGEGATVANRAAGSAQTASAQNAARRTADARLEIVPPGASTAKRAGTQSGIEAGGEGEMLRQELQQTKETLAARDAEVSEMKARIDELEKLQAQQQQLISMKDAELASAQKRLADSNQAEAKQPVAGEADAGPMPWLLGGLALLLAGVAGWWFSRRRGNAAATSFREAVTTPKAPSLADAFAPPAVALREAAPAPVAPAAPARREPAWHSQGSAGLRSQAASAAAPATPPAPATATVPPSGGAERLELARAYIDLGDQESARNLLSEVVVDADIAVRERAVRMLRELG